MISEGEEAFDGKNAMHMELYDDYTKVDDYQWIWPIIQTIFNCWDVAKIEATFSGNDIEDNWRALFAYTEIGRELGIAIADQFDKNITQYLQKTRPVIWQVFTMI